MRAGAAILWALATGPVVAVLLQGPGAAWRAMPAYHLGCVLAALAAGGGLGPPPRRRVLRSAIWLVATGAGTFATLLLAADLLPRPPDRWSEWGLAPPSDTALLLLYVLANPWIEEWFWRGALLGPAVRRRLGTACARALAVLGFWPLHVAFLVRSFGAASGAVLSLCVLPAACAWVLLRERSGHAWWCAASHQGADLGLVTFYLVFLRAA